MAPECVLYGKFSEVSDVWLFGVLCWEIFMFGQQPFAGLANEEVLGSVSEGKHPTPPDDCITFYLQCLGSMLNIQQIRCIFTARWRYSLESTAGMSR